MNLVVVESPTKAKTLSKFLPKDFVIKASMGHVRDLPKSGLGVDVENNFKPEYVIPDKAKKVIDDLKKESKNASAIYLATDPDREGEAISWHLLELLKGKKTKKSAKEAETAPTEFLRVVFHELTRAAIEEAFKTPGKLNMDLVDAQQARRVLDRLVGYKLSPLLWKKVRYGLSAGRVQSVAVRLIVERERERNAFKSEEYWSIAADLTDSNGKRPFTAELSEKNGEKIQVTSEAQSKEICDDLASDSFSVTSVKRTERRKNPYPPFKTSTLQQSMANVFGFTAKRTMDVAQKLFEKGFITYHRTDSFNLSPQFINDTRKYVGSQFGKDYLPESANVYKTKSANAQEAHEAIRPTDVTSDPSMKPGLTPDEMKVYSLIWKRSVECQMTPVVYDQTSLVVTSGKGYGLKASGSIVKFDGWLAVGKMLSIGEEEEETINVLPSYSEDDALKFVSTKPEQHFTQPPARYTDASLIKKMEELSVGRPSTYAPTIQTIQARGYVTREGRAFIPTDVAYVVVDLLVDNFPQIIDYGFTATLEQELDEIAEGQRKWEPVLKEFYGPFEKDVKEKDKVLSKADVTNLGESDEKCPQCGKVLVYKLGKYGKFLSCSGYPDCDYAKPLEEDQALGPDGQPQDFGECDVCKEGKMILKKGRFGKFLACSNYPKCKNTKPYLEKIGMKCPKCGDGDVIIKKAKRKAFYGCSRYPECDWSSWTNPMLGKQAKSDQSEQGKEEVSQIL